MSYSPSSCTSVSCLRVTPHRAGDARIILASSLDAKTYPADTAGLLTGDRILEINGKRVSTFSEIQESIALSARRPTDMVVNRDGTNVGIRIIPELDKDSGAGRIGIYPWIEPVVATVDPAGAAAFAGIQPLDTIIAIDGIPVDSTMAIVGYLSSRKPTKSVLRYSRAGVEAEADVVMTYGPDGSADLGLGWKTKNTYGKGPQSGRRPCQWDSRKQPRRFLQLTEE